MFCSRDYQLTSRFNQQNEKSTSNYASGCHDTVQYHTLSIQQLKLSANYTPHPIHLGKPLDSLYYMKEVTIHTMGYINAATTGILSPHVLPVKDLREMLLHIEEMLSSTMHLPN